MSATSRTAIALCVVASLAVSGCGLDQVRRAQSVPEETRASLGTVAVVPARYSPEVGLDVFAEGKAWGAVKGTAAGALLLPASVLYGGALPGSLAEAGFLAAVGAVVGCVVGTWKAVPQGQAADLHAEAKELLGNPPISEHIAERVYRLADASRHGPPISYLPDAGPRIASESADYRFLAEQGIDSVLEVSVREFGLSPIDSLADPANARVKLYLEVEARLGRAADGEVLYQRTLRVLTHGAMTIDRWHEGGAALVDEKFAPVEADVAERFVEDIFWVYVQPSQRGGASP